MNGGAYHPLSSVMLLFVLPLFHCLTLLNLEQIIDVGGSTLSGRK